ncbi:MAG TPA: hypothetical protein VGJ96_12750 [Gemmatimonadaceae bacterium]|jgi:hypothetical protein
MKNFLKISTAAAMMLSASVALAQNGSDVTGGTVGATVGGIFVPAPVTAPGGFGAGAVVVNLPPSTPVAVPPVLPAPSPVPAIQSAALTVSAVTTGAPVAVAAFTQTLQMSGVPLGAAQGLATALSQLSASPTVGSIITALDSWNVAMMSLTSAQVQALVSTPEGGFAVSKMISAYVALTK